MEPGTDKHKVAVDGLTKLMDRAIEIEKLDIDAKEKAENRKIDKELKLKQMEEDRKDRIAKNTLTAASIFGGFALTVWGTVKSIKFEETGTITTIMGRGFIQKLLPKK